MTNIIISLTMPPVFIKYWPLFHLCLMNFTIFIPIYCSGQPHLYTHWAVPQWLNVFQWISQRVPLFSGMDWNFNTCPGACQMRVISSWRMTEYSLWKHVFGGFSLSLYSVSLVSHANPTFLFVTHYKNKMLTKDWFHWYKRNYITTLATCRIPRSRVYQTSIRVAINCNRNCARQISFFFSKILFRLRLDVQESRLLPFVKVTNYNVPKEVCCWCLIIDLWLYHQSRNDISESPSERSQISAQDVPISDSAQLLKQLSGS